MTIFAWDTLSRRRKIILISLFVLFDLILVLGIVAWIAFSPPQAPGLPQRPTADTKQLPASIHEFEGKYYFSAPATNILEQLLKTHVNEQGLVNYANLAKDRNKLLDYYYSIAFLDPRAYERWSESRRMVFWINAYNALTLLIIIDNYPIGSSIYGIAQNFLGHEIPNSSIRNLPWVWEQTHFTVMGKPYTLNHIEHETLRKEFKEPRIHMAINCASAGCPPLRNEIYQEHQINKQLEQQTRTFLLNKAETKMNIDKQAKTVYLSPILDWFGVDFIATNKPSANHYQSGKNEQERSVLLFVSRYVNQEEANFLRSETYKVHYRAYDWSLNEAP